MNQTTEKGKRKQSGKVMEKGLSRLNQEYYSGVVIIYLLVQQRNGVHCILHVF
jgi:hypothetical protein